MKKVAHLGITFLCCFLSIQLSAQDARPEVTNEDLKVKKYTVMEQFEPDLVLSVNERVRLKKERLAAIERRRGILDTLTMPERRRERLRKELHKNPFSEKLNKAVAEIEFMEDEVEN